MKRGGRSPWYTGIIIIVIIQVKEVGILIKYPVKEINDSKDKNQTLRQLNIQISRGDFVSLHYTAVQYVIQDMNS